MSAVAECLNPGPELAPLAPHLPHTPIENLRSLFVHAVVQGLKDRDSEWVNSPEFITVCTYAGLEIDTALRIRRLFNRGRIDMRKLEYCFYKRNGSSPTSKTAP